MQRNAFHRAISFCLAAVMTVAVLGALDQLAQPSQLSTPEAQLALATSTRG